MNPIDLSTITLNPAEARRLTDELNVVDRELQAARRVRADTLARLAHKCPVRVGDVVTSNSLPLGVLLGRSIKVERIVVVDASTFARRVWAWKLLGKVLNKDGRPGRREAWAMLPIKRRADD